MYALVDCNNFYASCERVFAPGLRGRPVVVLSNNDGCVIARSAEAKVLGVPMGAPAFQWEGVFRREGVAVFSSNYALYGDMSARVMAVLGRFAPAMEVYSIDEAFVGLAGVSGAEAWCRVVREEVARRTGIPVSIGVGATKTLAKAANRYAKKRPECGGVFDLAGHPDPDAALAGVEVGDVWGIGPRYAKMLRGFGVSDAAAFKRLDRDWVQRRMTVAVAQTWLELHGRACFGLEEGPQPKKSVIASRSFGRPVVRLEELAEALALHVCRAGEKLRGQNGVASQLLVFVQTNRFKEGAPQYANAGSRALMPATAHTPTLIRAADGVLRDLFRPGYEYKKAGVMLSGIEPAAGRQLSLLELPPDDRPRDVPLMAVMDAVNARYGRDSLRPAASGVHRPWGMRQARRSPRYTTVWAELPVARAG